MKKQDIDHFRSIYPQWWSEALKSMPAGHVQLLASLFHQCDLIAVDNCSTEPWITLHFERLDDEDGLFRATAAPLVDFEKWTNGSALALIIALQFFNERQKVFCEVCGLPSGRHCISPDVCSKKAEH
ncbi:hypothetical protein HJA87_31145 [Rhizobium bangladeshense]|uniref:Uncharacterized protein n=1 Tax=Rhizobium bangladeshense TaxID=1138189 RepID=A0ABS7LS73_9HYPH|nr:hypothetical protein [Rhizobium bangladeshense]MBY3594259.1 hypothetical protein [Rhizobium bangladeshense]